MYFFIYDPKLKEELPYYDMFPLVLPIEPYHDGFLGINFHYLPINLRVILLDKLFELATDPTLQPGARIQASYALLSGAARYKEFKPCIKRYLTTHVQSGFLEIKPDQWMTAMYLPVENFAKASKQKVWDDSRNKI
jgi:hypothetical protein